MSTSKTSKAVSHANKAMQAIRESDYAAAVASFDRAGKLVLSNDRLSKAAGFAHLALGDEARAVVLLAASLKNNAAQPDVHAALGDIYVARSEEKRALSYLRKAVELAPTIPELRYKLGLALIGFDRWNEAIEQMRAALASDSRYIKARVGLGRALTEMNRLPEAEAELKQAHQLAPQNYAVSFRLAKLREKQQRIDEAIANYSEAETLSDHSAPVCEALGLAELARGNVDAALAAFRRGLKRKSFDQNLLRHATALRYEMGDPAPFSDYEAALDASSSDALHADYISRLIQAERMDDATLQLRRYEAQFGQNHRWFSLAANMHDARREFGQILQTLKRAPAGHHDLSVWRARALLGRGDTDAAEAILLELLQKTPRDQLLLALLSTCYRVGANPAYDELVNYDALLINTELAIPPGFSSLESFNTELRQTLEELHVTRNNPLFQSVVGGTQTPGNLLQQPHPVIAALRQAIDTTLRRAFSSEFYSRLNTQHPVSLGRGRSIGVRAAWSIWVTEGGYHRPHVHQQGWYSSAYYVSLPAVMRGPDDKNEQGGLAFGRPRVATPLPLEPDKVMLPVEGVLRLFPSFFWHETLPFHGSGPRVVVSFDASTN